MDMQRLYSLRELGFKPYAPAVGFGNPKKEYEFISYAFLTGAQDLRILVREVNKPWTMYSCAIPAYVWDFV